MEKCLFIEKQLGRSKTKKNEPRICDIDIIDYDNSIIHNVKNTNIKIPHPRMHSRNFILLPLFEIAKTWIHPIKKTRIKDLISTLDRNDLRAIKLI